MQAEKMEDIKMHLNQHQKYPATKEDLVKECDNLSDFTENDKEWFKSNLPDKTYNSADEVIAALKMTE